MLLMDERCERKKKYIDVDCEWKQRTMIWRSKVGWEVEKAGS